MTEFTRVKAVPLAMFDKDLIILSLITKPHFNVPQNKNTKDKLLYCNVVA